MFLKAPERDHYNFFLVQLWCVYFFNAFAHGLRSINNLLKIIWCCSRQNKRTTAVYLTVYLVVTNVIKDNQKIWLKYKFYYMPVHLKILLRDHYYSLYSVSKKIAGAKIVWLCRKIKQLLFFFTFTLTTIAKKKCYGITQDYTKGPLLFSFSTEHR